MNELEENNEKKIESRFTSIFELDITGFSHRKISGENL